MMKFSTLLCLALAFFAIRVGAQPYYNVSHTTGTVAVGGVNVTTTSSGSAGTSVICPGHNYGLGAGASAYTYTFNQPIAGLRIYSIGLDVGEPLFVSFNNDLNNYTITNANYTPYSTCGFVTPGIISAGHLSGGAGIITILRPQINSFKIQSPGNSGGSAYMLEILPLTASSTGSFCSGNTLTLNSNLSGATFAWTGPNGFSSNAQNPTIPAVTTAASGTYTVTSTSGLVSATQTVNVAITQTVTPTLSVVPNTVSVCSGYNSLIFNTTTSNGGVASYQWKVNATNVGANTPSYNHAGPLNNGDIVSCTMTSGLTCTSTPTATGTSSVTVTPTVTPSVAINYNPPGNICAGTAITFTATPTNGGATPTYQWKRNNVNVATGVTYNAGTGLVNGDIISCTMTSNALCVTSPTATSSMTMVINPVGTPTITITGPPVQSCAGTPALFKVQSVTLPGSGVTYAWKKNGVTQTTGLNYNAGTTLVTGDIILCQMTSSEVCASPSVVNSNSFTMNVNPVVTPSVTISANTGASICAGTSVTFTATPVNGGTPSYQWKKNGVNVGTGPTYVNSSLTNGEVITCTMTSSLPCATANPVNSNAITMFVSPVLTPTVTINGPSTLCVGSTIQYTTTAVAPGVNPTYQWKINGNNVGTNSSSYYNGGTLQNGDVLTCTMTSNYTCATGSTATGTKNITVNPLPTIAISADKGLNVCPGGSVVFSAAITGGGATPTYQWKKNGINVGTGPTYTTTSIVNNDVITCVLTSTGVCDATVNITSLPLVMKVAPHSISIVSDFGNLGCLSVPVTFTATPVTNATPTYQWNKNNVNVMGANSAVYVDNTLVSGDVIKCIMTSSSYCPSPSQPQSNNITMTINQPVIPVATITPSPASTICDGKQVGFSIVSVNGGLVPQYQWVVNGVDVPSATNSTYINYQVQNGDKVTCKLKSSLTCALPVVSNEVEMTVVSNKSHVVDIVGIPGPDGILFHSNVTNGGTGVTYQWKLNNVNIPGATQPTYLIKSMKGNEGISLTTHSTVQCAVPEIASSKILFGQQVTSVNSIGVLDDVALYPNPNNGLFTLKGKINNVVSNDLVSINVVNAIGQIVYRGNAKLENGDLDMNIDLGSSAAPGVYMIHITADGKNESLRFTVK